MPELHKAIARLMADRRQNPPAQPDSPGLRAVMEIARDGVSADEQPMLEDFSRAFFARDGAALLASAEPAQLAGMVRHAFRFLCARGTRPVALRVYVPSLERDGWASSHTVIEAVMPDRPFIVDTLLESIQQLGGEIRLMLHPILGIKRSPAGQVVEIGPAATAGERESFVHIEAAQLKHSEELTDLFTDRIAAVVRATDDYAAMRRRVAALAEEFRAAGLPYPWGEEAAEVAAFLSWLDEESFVYLGYREYEIQGDLLRGRRQPRPGSGLGILRDESSARYDEPPEIEPDVRRRLNEPPLMVVTKTREASPVHRIVPMDCIGLKQVAADGKVVGERRLLGLFTSKAYQEPSSAIPVLRRMLGQVLEREGVLEGSHDQRNLADLFDSFPKEELLASSVSDIRDLLRAIVAAEASSSVRVTAHWDAQRHGLFLAVILPRARFSTEIYRQVTDKLQTRLDATILDRHLVLDEWPQARLHYHLLAAPAVLDGSVSEILENDLNLLLRTWDDQLRHELERSCPPEDAEHLARRYSAGFPTAYKARTSIDEALRDILSVERLIDTGTAQIEFETHGRGDGAAPALKLYLTRERVVLSDLIPVLENLGLRVLDEQFVDLDLPKLDRVRIHTFQVEDAAAGETALPEAAPRLSAALHALRAGTVENDPLNRLVLRAGLDWRAVDLVRAYGEHARQIGVVAGRMALFEALTTHPDQARLLFGLFAAKFDPAESSLIPEERLAGPIPSAYAAFLESLRSVESLVHDRVLRALGAAVNATVRTNFYDRPAEGAAKGAIAIKVDCRQLPHLPRPRPMFEAYVHHATVEGVHLRGGPVARGGIRLSDRPDDFRAEILGLMKTQSVKNAVIVPVGAKGGFVVKSRADGRLKEPDEVEPAYRTFIGALLSITDNIRDGRVVSPPGQIVYDGPDPYLVVAADKGTAALSDTANAVASERGFWLGDAFASGGSHGYDHKKIAITARGAWECVRQHFRELGRDVDGEPVTVVGIGDMSGDVFGNGMLCSRTIRLRAAFDHRHIFLDPDPDPDASYRERERLFRLPRSSWQDYDPSSISGGGGVFPRGAKSVPLSKEAREMLAIEEPAPTGQEVVRAILRMEADLLWNGGIGTYVKSTDESDAEVRDHTNDAVRVLASELRVKVVGEGGNLGLTQRARIEFALAGGRINTDAIDNSGGVDMSDHEVNLKIAMAPALAAGDLSLEERNRILEEITGEVTEAVLTHNRRQALALQLDQRRSTTGLGAFLEHAAMLERDGELDGRLDHIPTRDALRARRGTYLGLTRPELAVLLAHTKLDLQRKLLASDLCDDPEVKQFFDLYFAAPVKARFGTWLSRHPLRREITSVELANRLVDSAGICFVTRLVGHTGRDPVEIMRAWVAAAGVSDALSVVQEVEAVSPPLAADAEAECYFAIEAALEKATRWVVDTQPSSSIAEVRDNFGESVQLLLSAWKEVLNEEAGEPDRQSISHLTGLGVPEPLAERVTLLGNIQEALEIALVAGETEVPLSAAAEIYLGLTQIADVDWIRRALLSLSGRGDRWQQRAVVGLLEGLMYARRRLARDVLTIPRKGQQDLAASLTSYADEHRVQLDRLNETIDDLKVLPQLDVARILVAMRELGRLVGRR